MARIDRETPVQIAIVDYLRLQYPSWIVHHAKGEINKRGKSIAIELAKAKRKGAIAGFPDLVVLAPMPIGPLFFEVKAEGNYASDPQKILHAKMKALGYRVAVVRSIDNVKDKLAIWLADLPDGLASVVLRGEVS